MMSLNSTAKNILNVLDRALSPAGNEPPTAPQTVAARAAKIAAELGIKLAPFARAERDWRDPRTAFFFCNPTPKLVLDCAQQTQTQLATPTEIERLRELSKQWDDLFAKLTAAAPTSDRLREIVAADAALHGTPAYKALGWEDARQLAFGQLRELKRELAGVTAQAQPIVGAIAQRVRSALETRLDQVLREEIQKANDLDLAFLPSICVGTLEVAPSRFELSRELPPGAHPTRNVLFGVLERLCAAQEK